MNQEPLPSPQTREKRRCSPFLAATISYTLFIMLFLLCFLRNRSGYVPFLLLGMTFLTDLIAPPGRKKGVAGDIFQASLRGVGAALLWSAIVLIPFTIILLTLIRFGYLHYNPGFDMDRLLHQLPTLLIAVSIPEELYFRSAIQDNLDRQWGTSWRLLNITWGPGLIVSSLCFMIPHIILYGAFGFLVFFPGLLFGLIYRHTRSLAAPVFLHLIFDLYWLMMTAR